MEYYKAYKYKFASQESDNIESMVLGTTCLKSQLDGYFKTKEEAIADYKRVYLLALKRFKEIKGELEIIQNRHNCYISYTYEGDTHGIHSDYQYVGLKIESYEFSFILESY